MDALAWISSGTPLSNVCLPFRRIVLLLGLRISYDLFIIQRIISFVFGLLMLACLAWLTREIFHDRTVTAQAGFLAALFPPRVILDVVPLSEIEFMMLPVAGFASFLHWLRSHRPPFVLLAGFLAGLSTCVRYVRMALRRSIHRTISFLAGYVKAIAVWPCCRCEFIGAYRGLSRPLDYSYIQRDRGTVEEL